MRVLVMDDQRDLGAPEDHRVAAPALHALDYLLEIRNGFRAEEAIDEFVHDESSHLALLCFGGPDTCQAALLQLFRVNLAGHQPVSPHEAEAAIATCNRLGCHHLGAMEPWNTRKRRKEREGLMDR